MTDDERNLLEATKRWAKLRRAYWPSETSEEIKRSPSKPRATISRDVLNKAEAEVLRLEAVVSGGRS